MSNKPSQSIAIIGAGAAGLYLAYRLSRAGFASVRVFEARARLGGRMHDRSVDDLASPIALGALSFSDAHPLVNGICAELGLAREPLHVVRAGYRLRDVYSVGADPSPVRAAYNLGSLRDSGDAYALLFDIIGEVAPLYRRFWREPDALWRYLSLCVLDGRALCEWGFWNLIARTLGPEAYVFVRDSVGLGSVVANTQAHAAIFTLLWETQPLQRHFRLHGGFSALAASLHAKTVDLVDYHMQHKLERVATHECGATLEFRGPGGAHVSYRADAVILTCPPASLDAVSFADAAMGAIVRSGCAAVREIEACRLVLSFARRCWPLVSASHAMGVFTTHAPLAQLFLEAPRVGDCVLTSFSDGEAAGFWRGLSRTSDGPANARACEAAMQELARVFGPIAAAPKAGWFIDWSRLGEGAAWHAWAIGADCDGVRARMGQPQAAAPLFICGEAFAVPQGWVEGALSSAEMVLERHFGMARPHWARSEFVRDVKRERQSL
jgi:monoamine oxidase